VERHHFSEQLLGCGDQAVAQSHATYVKDQVKYMEQQGMERMDQLMQ
jgi:hypothetical protein